MSTLAIAVADFLASSRIAVAGVSRDGQQAANHIYRKLKSTGHAVVATNPKAATVEGDPCYPDLRSIPGGVDALMIATPPAAAIDLVRQCKDLGVTKVWFHRSIGQGSVSDDAVRFCRENGISVIAGACPMMYCRPDPAHRCMRTVLGWMGRLPSV